MAFRDEISVHPSAISFTRFSPHTDFKIKQQIIININKYIKTIKNHLTQLETKLFYKKGGVL